MSRQEHGVVATTRIDGELVVGINSTSPAFTGEDDEAAKDLIGRVTGHDPRLKARGELRQSPTSSVFHAETTVLLRAAGKTGDGLAGRTLEIVVDAMELCGHCIHMLPRIGLELGNPTVTFIDGSGQRLTMRDGKWLKAGKARNESHFGDFRGAGWPTPGQLAPYFLSPPARAQVFGLSKAFLLSVEGADGTEQLEEGRGRIDVSLTMTGNPFHGVHFQYWKRGGGEWLMCHSKGDLRRLREWIETQDGDLVPVGLFVPFEAACRVVKAFVERDGALPEGDIAWFAAEDIPYYVFPRLMPPQMR